MSNSLIAILLSLVACVVSALAFPFVLRFAKKHNLVDNPNARKLQRVPVPVIGGTAVFIGIAVSLALAIFVFHFHFLWVGLAAMAFMWLIGTWDDLKDIPATFRFLVEVALVWGMMTLSDRGINDLHGLWGFRELSLYFAMPLSIIAGVGIMNAINLIDGVDGYCSGFGMVASILFSILFFSVDDVPMGCFSLVCAGALLPFFLHNVFGKTSKMFIGDGGSLLIGTFMTCCVFNVLSKESSCSGLAEQGMGLVPFMLAVLAIPVFDTLRVMTVRILRGFSPFSPDKTHLHHLFIEMHFTHAATSAFIILMDLFVVAVWFAAWKLGVSIDWQLYIVIGLSLLLTFGFYRFMRVQQAYNDGEGTALFKAFCRLGDMTHIDRKGFWKFMRRFVDGEWGMPRLE